MSPSRNKWRSLLWPLSLVYGAVTGFRNLLFSRGVRKSVSFPIPVISVGNITVGGTGKTPHIEYLAGILYPSFQVAVLSRGYRRKTYGFLLVTGLSTPAEVGDEPCQVKQKFPGLIVAVDRKRVHGINRLLSLFPRIQAILLDDAFQHRQVNPGLNILLTDYHRLLTRDCMLPAGNLREPARNRYRADCILVTKCPADLSAESKDALLNELSPLPSQEVYFTTLRYAEPVPVFPSENIVPSPEWKDTSGIVYMVTGIANPEPMKSHLQGLASRIVEFTFPDHHSFSHRDMEKIVSSFQKEPGDKRIITTEKDAIRLRGLTIPELVKKNMFFLPIRIEFLFGDKDKFDRKITGYVGTDQEDGSIYQE